MVLKRLGNKDKIASDIVKHFPPHKTYVDLFFGAGGIFFNKQQSEHSICNDLDEEVINFYLQMRDNNEQLYDALALLPFHQDLFRYWRRNKETEPLLKAVRFVFLSTNGLYGKVETFSIQPQNRKKLLLARVKSFWHRLSHVLFMNMDFRKAIAACDTFSTETTFVYADPPYIDTTNNYTNKNGDMKNQQFTKDDFVELVELLIKTNYRFAISHQLTPFIEEIAKNYGIEIIKVVDRQSLKKRCIETLLVNYANYELF